MIRGRVQVSDAEAEIALLQPRITISVAGSSRVFQTHEAMVDTGFTGWLTLPERNIKEIGLTHYGQRRVILANEEQIATQIYSALTHWHGQPRPVLVYQIEGIPLIGMAMLTGSRLTVDAWEGGDVVIEEVSH